MVEGQQTSASGSRCAKVLRRDVVIVGAGILGTVLAAHLSRTFDREVVVFAGSECGQLSAETLRSQSWLHSGLLYSGPTTTSIHHGMLVEGHSMLSEFGLKPRDGGGVFGFNSSSDVDRFKMLTETLGVGRSHGVAQLDDAEAKSALGSFYFRNRFYFRVPDTQFNPAEIMEIARREAMLRRVEFIVSDVELCPSRADVNGYTIRTSAGQVLTSNSTILCAGCGVPALLQQLNIEHNLAVFRSILVRTPETFDLAIPIFADRADGLTAVLHGARSAPPSGCLVLGDWNRTRLGQGEERIRVVKRHELNRLLALVPNESRGAVARGTAIAGHKIEVLEGIGRRSIDPWVSLYPDFPGLIAAVPGKATMAFCTAKRITELVAGMPPPRRHLVSIGNVLGERWTKRIRLHYERPFRDLDETQIRD